MIEKPVIQKTLVDADDYNLFWNNQVSGVVEAVFQNAQHFVSAYAFGPERVLKIISSNMRVVPIDIKEKLEMFYNELLEIDDGEPPRTSTG